jgi:hypothetical protein
MTSRTCPSSPHSTKPATKPWRASSFISGSLIGIAVALPIWTLDASEDGGASVLLGALSLAAAGVALYLRGIR